MSGRIGGAAGPGGDGGRAPAVAVRGLGRRFGGAVAVDGLEFDVLRGELFGLVGPDGAGKTTTLRMLAGVLRPTSGEARVLGIPVTQRPEAVKREIAYMSQRFGLYGDLTVRENLDFYADLYRVPRARRAERRERLYAFSRLGPFENRLAAQLSGGMKQKLSLSCSLIHEPRLLLLDEPTFGVDPLSRRDLWLILHEMVARGTTAVVSTAYMDEAERCDRVALLHDGHLVGLAPPARLQAELEGRIVALRTGRPRAAVEALRGLPGVRSADRFGAAVHVSLEEGEAAWPVVERALAERGIAVDDARPVRPSLEDVFMERVGRTDG